MHTSLGNGLPPISFTPMLATLASAAILPDKTVSTFSRLGGHTLWRKKPSFCIGYSQSFPCEPGLSHGSTILETSTRCTGMSRRPSNQRTARATVSCRVGPCARRYMSSKFQNTAAVSPSLKLARSRSTASLAAGTNFPLLVPIVPFLAKARCSAATTVSFNRTPGRTFVPSTKLFGGSNAPIHLGSSVIHLWKTRRSNSS
mmetsp:Transcript_22726/g.56645  ORF Transcript_22726/g.56645 Transcript_22726/m.56645 type:complete len:201 (-) Transcript_22726:1268-1870(-)